MAASSDDLSQPMRNSGDTTDHHESAKGALTLSITESLSPYADPFITPDGRAVVVLSGELDIAAVPAIRDAFADAIGRTRVGVIADLSGVAFIDASALGALVGAANRARHLRGGLNLAGVPDHMSKLLGIVGLSYRFPATGKDAVMITVPRPRDPQAPDFLSAQSGVIWSAARPDVSAVLAAGRIPSQRTAGTDLPWTRP
jgi:anti-sigma B factor antagonist